MIGRNDQKSKIIHKRTWNSWRHFPVERNPEQKRRDEAEMGKRNWRQVGDWYSEWSEVRGEPREFRTTELTFRIR